MTRLQRHPGDVELTPQNCGSAETEQATGIEEHPDSTLAIKDSSGKLLSTKDDVIGRWTEYCSELYKGKQDCSTTVADFISIAAPLRERKMNILFEEVQAAIDRLKRNKSPTTDGITAEMIQAGGEPLARVMHGICQKIWAEERMPEEWSQSVIVTIPKKGDLTRCTNYRTIILINYACKVMLKKVLLERLKAEMAEAQAGFRSDRSIVQQVLILRLVAEKAKRNGITVYNCFIDFQKAFDSIQQDVIWVTFHRSVLTKSLPAC